MSTQLSRLIRTMDRYLMSEADQLTIGTVCVVSDETVAPIQMELSEAREIMAEIDAKSSALLAVLAIILAASAFLFSLSQNLIALTLMFAQVATISLSIIYLLRCLIYEPAPHLRRLLDLNISDTDYPMQIEAIKQVRYFNRVILQTTFTSILFFLMCLLIGIEALMMT
ncbi:hypothetical protein [Marivita hallyeonensis]|uniref:Uncharacterized protein n=1 Tax=Marivita hallyeonensis TaxID=996342 RepID=A0A1M5WZF9_9RHOB|nr:hypothetical protein [Marivita hallyeonensis]SHH93066.1 hypothetical protein SAMN05443551_3628 [Marivita hallyeonensis]